MVEIVKVAVPLLVVTVPLSVGLDTLAVALPDITYGITALRATPLAVSVTIELPPSVMLALLGVAETRPESELS